MKNQYSIGEVAKLLGVSTQTLRYYDKINLISPAIVDENTGYRYYKYEQFHYIDRIKYLQKLGMELEQIREIIHTGDVSTLLPYLEEKKKSEEIELQNTMNRIKDIQWYIDYFSYMTKNNSEHLYKMYIQERYVISVPCYYQEPLADMEIRLAAHKSNSKFGELHFRRQYGYCLDFNSLLSCEFYPKEYFVFLRDKPDIDEKYYRILPEGEYICFQTPILKESWDEHLLNNFFESKQNPRAVIALEFEDNLNEYSQTCYEVQILL